MGWLKALLKAFVMSGITDIAELYIDPTTGMVNATKTRQLREATAIPNL